MRALRLLPGSKIPSLHYKSQRCGPLLRHVLSEIPCSGQLYSLQRLRMPSSELGTIHWELANKSSSHQVNGRVLTWGIHVTNHKAKTALSSCCVKSARVSLFPLMLQCYVLSATVTFKFGLNYRRYCQRLRFFTGTSKIAIPLK